LLIPVLIATDAFGTLSRTIDTIFSLVLLVTFIMVLGQRNAQGLHDILARTYVVPEVIPLEKEKKQ